MEISKLTYGVRASGQDGTQPHALSFRRGVNRPAEKSSLSGRGPHAHLLRNSIQTSAYLNSYSNFILIILAFQFHRAKFLKQTGFFF